MHISEGHREQDLRRSSRDQHPGNTESLQGDLPCTEGQTGQAALEKAKLFLGKAGLEINETQQGQMRPSRFVPQHRCGRSSSRSWDRWRQGALGAKCPLRMPWVRTDLAESRGTSVS